MKKVLLCILDGVGINEKITGNAVKLANTPNLDYLMHVYPNSNISASGLDVGLPDGQMGNSEVGHTNIGSGRIVEQELVKINKEIKDNSFYKNKTLNKVIDNSKKTKSNIHLYGLLSDGGIHSHIDHLIAILKLCKQKDFYNVYIHIILDGRDTEPLVGTKYVNYLQEQINILKVGKISTIMGRFYGMNRDHNWELTKKAYDAIMDGIGIDINNIDEAFKLTYKEKLTDEFMKPMIIEKTVINKDDSIITYNFRADRMLQLMHAINDKKFTKFKKTRNVIPKMFVTMTNYEENDFKNIFVIYNKEKINNTLGEVISNNKLRQKRITEFEKKAHVTFFFNGSNDIVYSGEDRKIFERPNVETYDKLPEMRSKEITNEIIVSVKQGYDLIVVNYPNGDAVGHSGDLKATIKAMEALDKCIEQIIKQVDLNEHTLIITADHGNAENMIDDITRGPDKMHTTNKVKMIVVDKSYKLKDGRLSDIAPTILEILNIKKPKEMKGKSLLEKR